MLCRRHRIRKDGGRRGEVREVVDGGRVIGEEMVKRTVLFLVVVVPAAAVVVMVDG